MSVRRRPAMFGGPASSRLPGFGRARRPETARLRRALVAPALSVLHRFASQTPIKEEVALPRIVRTTVWVPESPPSRDPNATPLMEEVQKSGGTENFDTSPWQREPPPGLDRTPTYEETRNPAWEAYQARIQKALALDLHEAQHKCWAHFFDGPVANTRSKKAVRGTRLPGQQQQRG